MPTPDALWTLTPEQRAPLVASLIEAYPVSYAKPEAEALVLRDPRTWLLVALLEPGLPGGDTLVSASEIVAWVGQAAAQRAPDLSAFVWGRIANRTYSGQLRRALERRHVRETTAPTISAIERVASAQLFGRLSEADQWTLAFAVTCSVGEQARIWGLTYDGAENRLRRARARLRKLSSLG